MIQAMKKIFNIVRFYRFSSLQIFFRLISFELKKLFGTSKLAKANIYGFQIVVPLNIDGIGRGLYVYRGRELDHKWMLEHVLSKGNKIFDLGANIGYYILLEAFLLDKQCKIFAVEPDERNIRILDQNIKNAKLENIVQYEQCAISNFSGKSTLTMDRKSNLSRIQKGSNSSGNIATSEVVVYDFVEYLNKIGQVDLLRMDIEGGEIDVFRSIAKATSERAVTSLPNRIIFETHDYRSHPSNVREVFLALFGCGYEVEFISSDDEYRIAPVFHKYGYSPIKVINEVGVSRGIYSGVSETHAVELISNWLGTRTVCLKRRVSLS